MTETEAPDAADLARVRRMLQTGAARQIRESMGVSQTEVARTVGVAPSCIGNWEQGLRKPTGAAAVRYLRLLERLLGGAA